MHRMLQSPGKLCTLEAESPEVAIPTSNSPYNMRSTAEPSLIQKSKLLQNLQGFEHLHKAHLTSRDRLQSNAGVLKIDCRCACAYGADETLVNVCAETWHPAGRYCTMHM